MPSTPHLRVSARNQPRDGHGGIELEPPSDTTTTALPPASASARPTRRPILLSFNEMPTWFQNEANRFVLNHYRPISNSIRVSFSSWLYLHNETINVYSHLLPALLFLPGLFYLLQYLSYNYPSLTTADFLAFSTFMLAAITCLSLSATYHTLLNHSAHMENFCLRLDMLGVVLFILGDLILGIYVVFWCETLLRYLYWSLVGIFGTLTILMTLHAKFQGQRYRLVRALMFVATGLCGVAPLIHGLILFGKSQMMMTKALPYTLAKAGCLLSGTGFYATRFPESRYPGKFDLWGSHSIFHVLVVCAAVVQLMGYLDAFDYAQANLACSVV
ncbi:hemolysin-III related-domain-containing protein [Podospora australis]|uniref:Hemolysin-III related-domain-containing protein n=1 Tax=Podospora australis TaxID=1536484 RepID=A0AAN6WU97_9PEZI|nr:hemolysin-III related-domain-containing protein [Podospora australis]